MPKMTVSEFFTSIQKPSLYTARAGSEMQEDLQFEVQLDEVALEVHQLIEIYKMWLQKGIHGYYKFITGNTLGTDRKSRRNFDTFMKEYGIQVQKKEESNFWTLVTGEEDLKKPLTTLLIHPCETSN